MNKRFNWKKILLEAGMIVLSILLALFINEWRSNYNDRLETNKMLSNIIEEMDSNQVFIDNLISYHTVVLEKIQQAALSDSLESTFLKNEYFEISEVAPKGIKQGDLHSIAWIVAKEEKISNRITFKESQMLFSVYDQQFRVLKTIDRIIGILSSREIHRKELLEESIIVLAIELNELIGQEKDLSYRYAKTLKELKGRW